MSADPASARVGGPSTGFPGAPPTREFGFAWLAYGLTLLGLFLLWPALVAAIVCLVRRVAVRGTVLADHHRWLLRTLAITTLGYLACIVLVFVGAWDVIAAAMRATPSGELNLDWGVILTSAGAAVIGGLGMTGFWFWTVYRLIRGALRLNDRRAVP
jgi:uncharacterized membrane protein